MPCPLPPRLRDGSVYDRDFINARNRYFMRCMALYASPAGTFEELAALVGVPPTTLSTSYYKTNIMTPKLAITLEKTFGRDFITREMLRPDLFVIAPK